MLHLLSFILLLHSYVCSCHQVCNHQDQSALLAFSANISTSPPWLPLKWSSRVSCCQWEGVECDSNGRVTHLQLPSRGLKGESVISSISSLVMLTHLNLSDNYLHGSLGEDFTRFTNLRVIDLSVNCMFGSIPQGIGKLLYLEKLHLGQNNLSGPIPPSLMNCTQIVEIILRHNSLNGDILSLDFSKLVHLQKLDLAKNSLSGTLPQSIYSCKSLIAIRASLNNISGQISPKIVELVSLSFLSLASNNFTNITMSLRVLAKCKNLTSLFLSFNFYGESLPVHRKFISLGEFPKLQFFFLEDCNFEAGPIPHWLSSIKSLRALYLGGNRLTGRVPNWLGTLPKLFYLHLGDNNLYGKLPLKLWQLPALISESTLADLNSSQFELPVFIYKSNNRTSNLIRVYRLMANYPRGIFLQNNAFSGNISEEIGNLHILQCLYLNDNQFSGHIPTTTFNLHNLEYLDLSRNNLSGEIPTSLTSLSSLSYFNVSYNDLRGSIPTGGQFSSFGESEFEGNLDLCGEPLNCPCSSPSTPKAMDRNGSHDSKKQFLDGLFVGFSSGFSGILVIIASFVWYHNYKRPRPPSRRG